ncbi:hypothetical protein SFRURICE_008456 [Spodoptera frugiperda]|nr:hypothetical protein SFRURICE_008456 [Spodoptera frugiperda]
MAEIAKINLKIQEMDRGRSRYRSRSGYRNCSRSQSRSRPRRTPESPDWLCSYHHRYRKRARKCVPPCNWKTATLPIAVEFSTYVTSAKDLEELSAIADKVMETNQPTTQISEVARSCADQPTNLEIATIMAEIAKINLKIQEMDRGRSRYRSRSGYRNCSRSQSRSRPRRTPESPDWLCSYHHRYRKRARKCVPPCNWKTASPSPTTGN